MSSWSEMFHVALNLSTHHNSNRLVSECSVALQHIVNMLKLLCCPNYQGASSNIRSPQLDSFLAWAVHRESSSVSTQYDREQLRHGDVPFIVEMAVKERVEGSWVTGQSRFFAPRQWPSSLSTDDGYPWFDEITRGDILWDGHLVRIRE